MTTTAELTLRTATAGDIASVDALLAVAYPASLKADYAPSVLVTAVPLISRARPELVTSGTYSLAEQGGRLLGAGGWTRAAPGGARAGQGVGHVRHLVVDHRAQRQGVGRALMARVLAEAREAGLTRLDCQATRTAVPFYAALGFEVLGPISVPLRPGIVFPAVAMRRAL